MSCISITKPENQILQRVLSKSFKKEKITHNMMDLVNQCNMIQLAVWWQEELLCYEEMRIRLKAQPHCFLYSEGCYDASTGRFFNVLETLQTHYGYDIQQAYYIANYFLTKIQKEKMKNYVEDRYPQLIDLPDYTKQPLREILENDQLQMKDGKSLTRTYAYLHNTRGIDRDLISHFIAHRYLAMDQRNNLCFLTYEKDDPIAVTKVGTVPDKRFVMYQNAIRNASFVYIKKNEDIIKNVFVFESCIELMSYLSLIKLCLVPEVPEGSAYLVLNSLNVNCLIRFLYYHKCVETVFCCTKNHINQSALINKINHFKGVAIQDMRYILRDYSFAHEYVHDWNSMLCHHLKLKP